jgi:dTDP-4-amino-4,6-dideoxygalactose transaminase
LIGLRALGVQAGDEVITSPFTFFATAETIALLGAKPVFVDIDLETFNLNPADVARRITEKTKAIVPVHLFGQAAEMAALQAIADSRSISILEDVAQAFGAQYQGKRLGSLGRAGAFSFFPSKNLGAYGDGGLLVTNDDGVAEEARMLRVHGSKQRYYHEALGYASRLDELQAAILRVKLPWIDEKNRARQDAARRYREVLSEIPGLVLPEEKTDSQHVYHQFTVRITEGRRDEIHRALAAEEITTMIYYPVALHQLPLFQKDARPLPHAEQAAAEVLSLPMWAEITPEIQLHVADRLKAAMAG